MAFTQERFDRLVCQLEAFAHKQPASYRWRVGLLAMLGYGYLMLVLAALLAIGGGTLWIIIASHRINVYLLKFGIIVLIPAVAILRSFWVSIPPPTGLTLSRQQVPRLFALVDQLTKQLQAPRFHHILITQDFNAAVVQAPRLGIFGWQQNYLIVGLPLMQALSVEQFTAVLAHELGHLSGNHARFAGWIYRVRKTWMQVFEQLNEGQRGSSILFDRFFNWYAPFFSAYSFVLARMDEYTADRCAAQLAGARNTAEALINVEIKSRFLQDSFWSGIYKQAAQLADPPTSTYTTLLNVLRGPALPPESQQWLSKALVQKTNNDDTHPCLRDRLKALGYQTDHTERLPLPTVVDISAADALLGNAAQEFAHLFDELWKTEVATSWRQRYGYLQEIQTKLQGLEKKAKLQALTDEEIWERACCTLELQGEATAMPLLQAMVATKPDHPGANYTLGKILLQQEDPAGVAYVEQAMDQSPDWVLDGCALLYSFYWQQGKEQEAKQYRDRAEQHYQILQQAQQERSSVSATDTFQSHGLQAADLAALTQQLAEYRNVKTAYLVQKVVNHFPEKPFCILGVIRKRGFWEVSQAEQDGKLVNQLAENLHLPTHGYILILNHSTGKLSQKIRQVPSALIYQQ